MSENSMNDKNEEMNNNNSAEISKVESAPNNGRRKIIMGSLAVPPVIMSITGRSAWGAAQAACTESGQLSGNLSAIEAGVVCSGEGCNGIFWKNDLEVTGSTGVYHHFLGADGYNSVFMPPTIVIADSVTLIKVIKEDIIISEFISTYVSKCLSSSLVTLPLTTEDVCRQSIRELLKESLTALFNSASAVPFELSASKIAALTETAFRDAITSGGIEVIDAQKDDFKKNFNDGRFCPL